MSSDEGAVEIPTTGGLATRTLAADRSASSTPEATALCPQTWKSGRLERLLRAWKEVIRNNTAAHRRASFKLKRRFYIMGGTAAAFGALITAINLAFAQNPIEWLMITTNIATGGVAALTALVTILGDDGSSVKHHEAAIRYQALELLIMNILGTPCRYRDDPVSILNSIRHQFDDISSSTPMLPGKEEEQLEFKVNKRLPKILNNMERNARSPGSLSSEESPENTQFSSDNNEIRDRDRREDIVISVDLNEHPGLTPDSYLRIKEQVENDRCGISNKNRRYDIFDVLISQKEQVDINFLLDQEEI